MDGVTRRRLPTVLAAAALSLPLAAAPLVATPASAAVAPLHSGFSIPWAIAQLPGYDSALMTERDSKRVYWIRPGRAPVVAATINEARPGGEGGLLGIVAAPDFARTKQYFVYYSTDGDNRVARMTFGSSARPVPIVTGIPRANIHNGGGLVFGGNDLYVGTGDAGNRDNAQNTASLGGKVLKVTRSGAAAPGNRWGRVATIGHRNVQGLAWTASGVLFASELGQDTQDEVNHIARGGNYGWPIVEGSSSDRRFVAPAHTWSTDEASPSGIAAVGNTLYVAALRGQRLWKLTTSGTRVTSESDFFNSTYGRLRAVSNRGNGSLWITTSNGSKQDRLLVVRPAP